MKIDIAIGREKQSVELEDSNVIRVLKENISSFHNYGSKVVSKALDSPIGSPPLEEIINPGDRITIVTSDMTRPFPSQQVLEPLLHKLNQMRCRSENITIVFALGNHRHMTKEEREVLVGKTIYHKYKCVDSDQNDFIAFGETSTGTPVEITRLVAESDRRICLGNIEYHYFAGYSGGAKAIMPGCSTKNAIKHNHSKMVDFRAIAGELEANPVRIDMEEVLRFCPVDFIVNVVLDKQKRIVYAVAGDVIKAHRVGCRFLDSMYLSPIPELADIVICSQGGYPKDMNLYQTQKALDNAKHAVREGGIIILVGACDEGLGDKIFENWIVHAERPEDLVERIQNDFQLGGHKAAAIALVLKHADIYLVSHMDPNFVRSIFMSPFETVQQAYDAARAKLGIHAKTIVMPYGGSTLPKLERS